MKFDPVFLIWGFILLVAVFLVGCRGPRVPSDSLTHPPSQKEEGKKVKSQPPAVKGMKESESINNGGFIVSVIADMLNFRACPGVHCQVLTILRRGDVLIPMGSKGEWMRAQVKSTGQEGWVSSRYVRRESLHGESFSLPVGKAPTLKEDWAVPEKSAEPSTPIKEEYIQ